MNSAPLDKDMISQPELWGLALLVSTDRLDIALYPPVAREELIWRTFRFDDAAPTPLQAIEDIIYANPLLFSDFKRVDCIIDNVPALLLPTELGEQKMAAAYTLSTASTADEFETPTELYASGDSTATVALRQMPEIKAFFQRTFYNVRFTSRLAHLTSYLLTTPGTNCGKRIYALAREGRLTLIVADEDRLLLANNYTYDTDLDALYYILAVRRLMNLDPDTTPVLTSPIPQGLTDLIHTHISTLGAIPFPMLRYRATKATLQAPFDLIIHSLCV